MVTGFLNGSGNSVANQSSEIAFSTGLDPPGHSCGEDTQINRDNNNRGLCEENYNRPSHLPLFSCGFIHGLKSTPQLAYAYKSDLC